MQFVPSNLLHGLTILVSRCHKHNASAHRMQVMCHFVMAFGGVSSTRKPGVKQSVAGDIQMPGSVAG